MRLAWGDYLGRVLRIHGGELRFYGLTVGWFGIGVIRRADKAPSKARRGDE